MIRTAALQLTAAGGISAAQLTAWPLWPSARLVRRGVPIQCPVPALRHGAGLSVPGRTVVWRVGTPRPRAVRAHRSRARLGSDTRFATAASRRESGTALADAIADILAGWTAQEREDELLRLDIGCVVADEPPVESLFVGELADGHGWLAGWPSWTVPSWASIRGWPRSRPSPGRARPRRRAAPWVSTASRCSREFGYGDEVITDLAVRDVVVLGSGRPVADRPVRRGSAAVPDGGSAAARRRCPCG